MSLRARVDLECQLQSTHISTRPKSHRISVNLPLKQVKPPSCAPPKVFMTHHTYPSLPCRIPLKPTPPNAAQSNTHSRQALQAPMPVAAFSAAPLLLHHSRYHRFRPPLPPRARFYAVHPSGTDRCKSATAECRTHDSPEPPGPS